MQKLNKVTRVNFAGGFIGLLAGSSKGKIQKTILDQNADGWNFIQYIPDQPNLIIYFLRTLLLIVTLGLWTISTGYLFVFEKPR